MIVKHPFRNGKRKWAAGDKYTGGLSESELKTVKEKGCFEPATMNQEPKDESPDYSKMSAEEIQGLKKAGDVVDAIEHLDDEVVLAVFELEEKAKKPRASVIAALKGVLEAE